MERRHYLMSWPNSDYKDGFYVTIRNKCYTIGHESKGSGDGNVFQADHQQTITRQAYMVLKAIAVRNRRRILAAAANRQQARKERKQACTSSSTKPPE